MVTGEFSGSILFPLFSFLPFFCLLIGPHNTLLFLIRFFFLTPDNDFNTAFLQQRYTGGAWCLFCFFLANVLANDYGVRWGYFTSLLFSYGAWARVELF